MDNRSEAAFELLDSPNISAFNGFVDSLKKFEKESWVVESLMNYYLKTESMRAADLIAASNSMHEKVIFKKLHSAFEDRSTRITSLKLLLHIVSKKPPWLHKVVHENIFTDLIRCMKNDGNIQALMEAVYIVIMLLPIVPDGMVKPFDSMFDAFIRLITFAYYNPEGIPEEYLLHLNVGIHSLFSRLYGMYPWHLLNALQEFYSKNTAKHELYKQVIEPMLARIKFNPSLVTASKEKEVRGEQWRRKEVHDIVAECASLSLDSTESTKDYATKCPVLGSNQQDGIMAAALNRRDVKINPTISSSDNLPSYLSAAVELAKDSLVSAAVNSSTFFSPSDRLGLSTPPNEPTTPGFLNGSQNAFNFGSSSRVTPQQVVMSLKTPHNTNHNTPTHITPKETPTTPLDDCSTVSHSRHASGNKGSSSRISFEESIPPSPLRKEFTNEPPIDVPKVLTASSEINSANVALSSDTLSVSNLPHLLEKISDTGSAHDSEMTNNTDDEEVSSITQPLNLPTTQSVAEFMKTVNRIRFNSMTVAESEKSVPKANVRPGSCPPFHEDMVESFEDEPERSSSIQTKSSVDLVSTDIIDDFSTDVGCKEAGTAMSNAVISAVSDVPSLVTVSQQMSNPWAAAPISHTSEVREVDREVDSGPGAVLDQHLHLLSDQIRLGAIIHRQRTESADPAISTVNWSYFGGSAEVNLLKGQLALLHTQLLYERQKRELHAERNRRLLSKIARAEKFREENRTLEKKLKEYENDKFNLETTCRLNTTELRKLREEKVRNESRMKEELAKYIEDNERLKCQQEELQRMLETCKEECQQKNQELGKAMESADVLEREGHMLALQVESYHGYEDEVSRMKKELLLMGEIQIKYEEKLTALKLNNQSTISPELEQGFTEQVRKLKETNNKQNEAIALRQSQIDVLNTRLKEKEDIIKKQYDLIEKIKGEHSCKVKALEEKYRMSQAILQSLEVEMMSLYDQIGRLSSPMGGADNLTTKHQLHE